MQKIRPLDKPGDENLPRAAWTVFSVSTASFRWAGRKAATHFVPQAAGAWVDTFLLTCQAENPGKERDWT